MKKNIAFVNALYLYVCIVGFLLKLRSIKNDRRELKMILKIKSFCLCQNTTSYHLIIVCAVCHKT